MRFRVDLNAPPAIKDDPLTYLDKGQTYTITVSDTHLTTPSPSGLVYHMVVGVLFSNKELRSNSAKYLQGWKDAQESASESRMVKYIGQQGLSGNRNSPFQIQSVSLNGFSGTWAPETEIGPFKCAINVNFHFLSSDFSHARGSVGTPFRLSVQTMVIPGEVSEICYRSVKLYRENGAERQNSNDMTQAVDRLEKDTKWSLVKSSRNSEKSRQKRKALVQRLKVLIDMLESYRAESTLDMIGDPEDD